MKTYIAKKKYENFLKEFNSGNFGSMVLGQAFYNHFYIRNPNDNEQLYCLYTKDGDQAKDLIIQFFNIS